MGGINRPSLFLFSMVDFFGHQDRARRNTGKLVFYFFVSVGLTICLVYLVLAFFLNRESGDTKPAEWLWNSQLFMWASAGTLAVVFLGSLMKIAELSAGAKQLPKCWADGYWTTRPTTRRNASC